VILVEGIFDYVGVYNLLSLKDKDWLKCCFTFGNSIGRGQIDMLLRKKVKNIILLYDYGTIKESKEAALRMRDLFDSVWVAAIKTPGVDPGNISLEELNEVFDSVQDPLNFYLGKV
jgi:hypothetical protein